MIRQKEATKEHQREMQADSEASLNRLGQGSGGNSQGGNRPRCRQSSDKRSPSGPQCSRCSHAKHTAGDRCPAMGATCHKCNRNGHFSAQCFSKMVAVVPAGTGDIQEDLGEDQPMFLGSVTSSEETSWSVDLRLKQKTLTFKLDMGAEVTAISEDAHCQIRDQR